jgi:hypothetical protein
MLRLDYQELLRSFPVVVLTAYDSASFSAPYRGSHQASDRLSEKTNATISRTPFRNVVPNFLRFADALPTGDASARLSDDYLTAVREEFRRFAFELSRTPGKKIISNWEFENDCPDVRTWDICRTYYQARIDGIVAGREQARRLGYPAEVYTMFEFTIVPGFAGRLSGLVEVGGKLRGVDFWSYSSWWSFNNPFTSAEGVKGSYVGAVRLIDEFAVSRGLSRQIMIGEVGELWDLFPQGDRLKAAIQGALEAGAVYVFNWVLYEQPGQRDEFGRDASHYGKFFLNRTLTPQGEMFRRFLWEPYRIPREVGVAPQ